GLRVSEEQRLIEEEEADELYRDQESSSVSSFVTSMINPISDAGVESIFTTASSPIAPIQTSTPVMTPSTIATITTSSEATIPPTTIPNAVLENLPTFDSVSRFEDRVKSLEVNFSKFMQINQFAEAVSKIPENDEFLLTIDENMKKIIKGQVKSQVKEQVSRILPRIEESVNAQLEAEVLTRSSHSSRTSYAVVANLTEMELKKILIEKMEGNKFIQRSDEQRNLYKALVDAYEADKTILESYGDTAILKRRRGEPESASTPSELATRSASRSITGTQSRQMSASESAFAEEPVQTTCQMDEPPHPPRKPLTPNRNWNKTLPAIQGSAQTWIIELAKQADSHSSFNELLDTPIDFSKFIMNRLGPLPLIPDNRGRRVIPFAHFINNDLEYLRGGASSRKYTTSVTNKGGRLRANQRRVEDLQLGVESYQNRLNLTKPDTYRFDLKRREAYTAYSNPRGFIYQNKDKKNTLMRIDELHKFSDGTLNDVRNALDDRLKGIRMQYLRQTIWRKGDKDRAVTMI
nr:hypothetical protein [Tanacetum cinerariifolium]